MMTIEISGLSYFIIITIACIVIVSMVLNFIDYCGKKIFKHKLISLSEIAIIVQKELNDYFVPTHLITDNDIQTLKEKYAPFNDKIDKLKSHKYFCFYYRGMRSSYTNVVPCFSTFFCKFINTAYTAIYIENIAIIQPNIGTL